MATKSNDFNLSEVIRQFRKAHRGASAKNALDGIKRAHPKQKINEGTFRATFYKMAGTGKRKTVRRRKPRGVVHGNGQPNQVLRTGLDFIRLAGGVEQAKAQLAGLAALIETAKAVQ
jgi:hypothetical protein